MEASETFDYTCFRLCHDFYPCGYYNDYEQHYDKCEDDCGIHDVALFL